MVTDLKDLSGNRGVFPYMAQQTQVPKFAHLDYQILHEFEISINEYFLLDMIFRLSGNGHYWCNKKLENIAFDMRITKRGVQKLRDRLIERKLLLKGIGNRLRTSEKWNKVHFIEESVLQKSEQSSKKWNKVHPKVEQSSSKTSVENNRRLTLERGDKNLEGQEPIVDGPGRAYALTKLEEIKRRMVDKVRVS
jgi:hypothetical protein